VAVVDASTLTATERVALLEADTLWVDAGLDLLDADDNLVEDITDDFVAAGSSVDRGIYRTIHGTATLNITRDIDWGSQRLRPSLLASADGVSWVRWVLGVFLPQIPRIELGSSPRVYAVTGVDKLDILDTPYGATFKLEAGTNIVSAVESIIEAAGETRHQITQTDVVAAADRVFPITDQWTSLGIVNNLLGSIGHQAVWCDRFGRYRSDPYQSPSDRSTVWSYSASNQSTTTIGRERAAEADYYRAANVVTGWNTTPGAEVPTPYSLTNQADGPTSINARGGRTIRRYITGSYETQVALESAVQAAFDAEKRVAEYVDVATSPNPTHSHFDVVAYTDDELPTSARYLVTEWVLPLDSSDMTLRLRKV